MDRSWGPIAWPACSPNLTLLDLFLWGHMKRLVYETPADSEEDLLARVMVVVDVELQVIMVIMCTRKWYVNTVYVLNSLVSHRAFLVSLVSGPRTSTYSKQQKWRSSTCDVEVFWL